MTSGNVRKTSFQNIHYNTNMWKSLLNEVLVLKSYKFISQELFILNGKIAKLEITNTITETSVCFNDFEAVINELLIAHYLWNQFYLLGNICITNISVNYWYPFRKITRKFCLEIFSINSIKYKFQCFISSDSAVFFGKKPFIKWVRIGIKLSEV